MKIFTNKNIRNIFLTVGTAFIAFMTVCIFAVSKITTIISTALLCAATFLVLYRYFYKQNNTIENAEKQITEFIEETKMQESSVTKTASFINFFTRLIICRLYWTHILTGNRCKRFS